MACITEEHFSVLLEQTSASVSASACINEGQGNGLEAGGTLLHPFIVFGDSLFQIQHIFAEKPFCVHWIDRNPLLARPGENGTDLLSAAGTSGSQRFAAVVAVKPTSIHLDASLHQLFHDDVVKSHKPLHREVEYVVHFAVLLHPPLPAKSSDFAMLR